MSATLATLSIHINATTSKVAELVRNGVHEFDIVIAGDKLPLARGISVSHSFSNAAENVCTFDVKDNDMLATVLALADFNQTILIVEGEETVAEITPLVSKEKLPRFFGLHPNSIWMSNDFDVPLSDDILAG